MRPMEHLPLARSEASEAMQKATGTARVEAFTDGVLAIDITIMGLELCQQRQPVRIVLIEPKTTAPIKPTGALNAHP